jgi:hypothetical protein
MDPPDRKENDAWIRRSYTEISSNAVSVVWSTAVAAYVENREIVMWLVPT